MKACYTDIIGPMPHSSEMSDKVYHQISLDEAYKTVACKDYATSRKYKKAWARLIDKNLDAG